MHSLVVTNINLPSRLYRSGILKFFSNKDLNFFISDLSYVQKQYSAKAKSDFSCAQKLLEVGFLKIHNFDEASIKSLIELKKAIKPVFLIKTISSFLLAKKIGCPIISEDEIVRTEAKKLGISAMTKENLIDELIIEIYTKGHEIDIEIVKMIT